MVNYKGKIVEVTWMDAAGELVTDMEEIDSRNPSDFLVLTKTYGRFYKEDDNAILILMEESEGRGDYCAIPKNWILKSGIKIIK